MDTPILDSTALVIAVGAVLVTLGLMERLAARALRRRNLAWRRHYQRVPKHATVVADCAWHRRNWVTAFCAAPHPGAETTLRFISAAPLDERQSTACLRWLQAEGFDLSASARPGDQPTAFEGSFPV